MAERIGITTLRYFDLPRYDELRGIKTPKHPLRFPDPCLSLAASHPAIPALRQEDPDLLAVADRRAETLAAMLNPLMNEYWSAVLTKARQVASDKRILTRREHQRDDTEHYHRVHDLFAEWVQALLWPRIQSKAWQIHQQFFHSLKSNSALDRAGLPGISHLTQGLSLGSTKPWSAAGIMAHPDQGQAVPPSTRPGQQASIPDFGPTQQQTYQQQIEAGREQLSRFVLGRILSDPQLLAILKHPHTAGQFLSQANLLLAHFHTAWRQALSSSGLVPQGFRQVLAQQASLAARRAAAQTPAAEAAALTVPLAVEHRLPLLRAQQAYGEQRMRESGPSGVRRDGPVGTKQEEEQAKTIPALGSLPQTDISGVGPQKPPETRLDWQKPGFDQLVSRSHNPYLKKSSSRT